MYIYVVNRVIHYFTDKNIADILKCDKRLRESLVLTKKEQDTQLDLIFKWKWANGIPLSCLETTQLPYFVHRKFYF